MRRKTTKITNVSQVTPKQLRKFRKEAAENRERGRYLSKRHGQKIMISDLNPHLTAGRKFPKSAISKRGRKLHHLGHANTRTKVILIDSRTPKSLQHRVVKHEIEHLNHPRATEKEIRKITKRKHGFTGLKD